MIRSITNKISENVSSSKLYEMVNEVCMFHRIQASPGYRLAAEYCLKELKSMGIESEILSFDANLNAKYLSSSGFKEWSITSAKCDLVLPYNLNLADYSKDAISVIQRSMPCDYKNEAIEIIDMDKGHEEQNYKSYDLSNKILFVRDDFNKFMWAINNHNALGFITDYVVTEGKTRTREDQYDLKRYTSFWYYDKDDEINCFGFVISPRMGDKLKDICLNMKEKGELPKVTCHVDSSLYDGKFEVVTGFLPGEIDEEILVTAHLYHPKCSANDNASGVSAAIETLNVIKTMIEKKKLNGLKRGIRLILIPEFTGTYAYLHSIGDDNKKILAGINLDMVGGKQSGKYGPLTITYMPYCTPSFASDLAILILDELKKDANAFGEMVPLFNSAVIDFVGGSDHLVLCDPTINIPTPMLIEYPDLNYHTSGDTIEMIDENLLKKSCTLSAAYCYCLSNLDENMLQELFNSMNINMVVNLSKIVDKSLNNKLNGMAQDAFNHICDFYIKACKNLTRFIPNNNEINSQKEFIESICTDFIKNYANLGIKKDPWVWEDFIPKRLFKGPINRLKPLAKSDAKKRSLNEFEDYIKNNASNDTSDVAFNLVVFYMDGMRKISEIYNIVSLFTDINKDVIKRYVDLLIALELVEKL